MVLAVDLAANSYIDDLGPANIFWTSDQFIYHRRDRNGFWLFLSDAIRCLKCLSLWLATGLLILRAIYRPAFLVVAVPLSVSRIITEKNRLLRTVE